MVVMQFRDGFDLLTVAGCDNSPLKFCKPMSCVEGVLEWAVRGEFSDVMAETPHAI